MSLICTWLNSGPTKLGWGLNPMTDVLIREPVKIDTQGRQPCDDEGREWDDAAIRQGTPELDTATGS